MTRKLLSTILKEKEQHDITLEVRFPNGIVANLRLNSDYSCKSVWWNLKNY